MEQIQAIQAALEDAGLETMDSVQPAQVESARDRKNRKRREARAAKKAAGQQTAQAPAQPTEELEMKKEDDRTSIASRAMLANVTVGFWEGRKLDKEVTDEVITGKKAEGDAGNFWTRIVPPSSLKAVSVAVNRGRAAHWNSTLPWSNSGPRILSAKMYLDYTRKMREAEAEFEKAVADFLDEYPNLVANAQKRLGGLFKPEMYPTVDQLRGKFTFTIDLSPLPTAGDFRVDLGSEQTEAVKRQIEKRSKAAMETAMGDLWNRLYSAVSKIAERLGDPEATFRDSLMGNLTELCDLLPKMNVTDNRDLERMRQDVAKKLGKQDPGVLRKNKTARADTAKAANDILKQMEAFLPKK